MLRSLLLPTLSAALAAQTGVSPNRFVPADSVLVARIAAPAVWQQRFAKSQIVKLLHAPTLGPLTEQLHENFEQGLEDLRSSGKFDVGLLEKLLRDYHGTITIAVQFDWSSLAGLAQGEPPAGSAIISLSPEAGYDLGALVTEVAKRSEENGRRPMRDLVIGDHTLRIGGKDEMQVSLPTLVDGHLVMLFGTDLAQSAPHLLAETDRLQLPASQAPLFVSMPLHAAIAAIVDVAANEADGAPFDLADLMHNLGFDCLEHFEMSLDAEGQRLAVQTTVELNEQAHGLFGALAFDGHQPTLLRFTPASADQLGATPFDAGAFYDTIEKVWRSLGDAVPITFDDAVAKATEALKVRLKEDLIDHLGTELLVVQDNEARTTEPDEDDPTAAYGGMCLAVSLRDGKAFGAALETALRSRGLHASRKSEEYAGTTIYKLRLGGVLPIEYAVTEHLFALTFGKQEAGPRNLRSLLDAHANATAEVALPAGVQKQVASLPPGWSGLGVTNMAASLRSYDTMFTMLNRMNELPEPVLEMVHMLSKLGDDLQRLGMASLVSGNYSSAKKISLRMLW